MKSRYCSYCDKNVLVSGNMTLFRTLIGFSGLFTCGLSWLLLVWVKEKCPHCKNTELEAAHSHKKATMYTDSNISIGGK